MIRGEKAASMAVKPTSGFAGFTPACLAFLRDLAANNERAWFMANKPVYEREVVAPLRLLLADLIAALAARDIPLTGAPDKSIFRIHRDVRFSHDKQPYKTHAGAVLTRDGSKTMLGLLYLHIAPDGCFVAAGFYHPEREPLAALREAIYTEQDRFAAMRAELARAGLSLSLDESLTRLPRGFEDATDPHICEALRLKSFVVRRDVATADLAGPALVGKILAFAEAAEPLLRFGWHALSVLDPTDLKRQK
jgi:uncharacterized protein (TIGR02453 family)